MRRMFVGVAVAVLATGILVSSAKHEYDDAMFVPRPRDFERMETALRERFGSRVRLISVPVVNRDVNGIAGYIEVPKGWRSTTYGSDDHRFSFERFRGRPVCLMSHVDWELRDLRRTLERRG